MVQVEQQKKGREIPIVILVNKADLKDKRIFLGKDVAERIVFSSVIDQQISVYKTSNYNIHCYEMPLTIIFNFLAAQFYSY